MDPVTWLLVIGVLLLILSYVITSLLSSSKNQQQLPANLKDFKFPVPDEGAPQIVTFGDVWTPNWQVLWVGNYKSEAIYASTSSGKK